MPAEHSSWSKFFYFSAIFNFAAAGALIFTPELFFTILGMQEIYLPEILPWVHQFAVLVLVFGIGYWCVGVNPSQNRIVVWMGCIGKTLVFASAALDSITFPALIPFAIFVVADLIFALFFARYLAVSKA